MALTYAIGAVSKLTGLGLDTLRAWERRYEAVKPARGARGRLYDDNDIRRLKLLRAVTEAGHAISSVAALSDTELERIQQSPAASPEAPQPLPPSDWRAMLDRYDSRAVESALAHSALLLKPSDLVKLVVLPLMREVGELWEQGTCRIAHEHMVSGNVRSLLGSLVVRQETDHCAGQILFATPEGELHELGVLAAALLAVAYRFRAVYLGPNLPAAEILHAVSVLRPRAVVLGLSAAEAGAAGRASLPDLAAHLWPATELWIGGGDAGMASLACVNTIAFASLEDYEHHLEKLARC